MNPSGNGIGLYISRKICRALGGDLTVSSNVGSGSIFRMSIDCKPISDNKPMECGPLLLLNPEFCNKEEQDKYLSLDSPGKVN